MKLFTIALGSTAHAAYFDVTFVNGLNQFPPGVDPVRIVFYYFYFFITHLIRHLLQRNKNCFHFTKMKNWNNGQKLIERCKIFVKCRIITAIRKVPHWWFTKRGRSGCWCQFRKSGESKWRCTAVYSPISPKARNGTLSRRFQFRNCDAREYWFYFGYSLQVLF